jgi:predicted secreted protein
MAPAVPATRIAVACLAALVALTSPGIAQQAQQPPRPPAQRQSPAPPPPPAPPAATVEDEAIVLRLSESATRTVTQDRLTARLRAEAGGSDPRKLQDEINRRIAAALAKAKSIENVRAETGGYWVYEDVQQRRGQRWWGAQTLTLVTTAAPAALLELVGQLQQDGLLVGALSYDLSPEASRAVQRALIPEAVARLKARAETFGRALDLPRVRIREVRALERETHASPMPRAMMAMRGKEEAAAPIAEPGETTVELPIEAEVELTK